MSRLLVTLAAISIMTVILMPSGTIVETHAQNLNGYEEPEITEEYESTTCGSTNFELTGLLAKNIHGKIISASASGSQIMVDVSIVSNCEIDNYPLLIVFEVKDEDESARYLAYQNVTTNMVESIGAGFSWLTEDAGDYRFAVFVISCLNCSGDFGIIKWFDFSVMSLVAID